MPQQIVFTDKEEDEIIKNLSSEWKLSKAETIKKVIRICGQRELPKDIK